MNSNTENKYKISFVNHGKSLEFFTATCRELRNNGVSVVDSHIILDKNYFNRFKDKQGTSEILGDLLFEWDLYEKAKSVKPDIKELEELEKFLNVPSLWPLLFSDRRIFLGKKAKFTADYSPRYSYQEMKSLAFTFITQVKQFFERTRPDVIVIFTPATLVALSAFYVAKAMGIKVFAVKSTKVSNLVTLTDSILEEQEYVNTRIGEFENGSRKPSPASVEFAEKYLSAAEKSRPTYEGSLQRKNELGVKFILMFIPKLLYSIVLKVRAALASKNTDPHFHDPVTIFLETNLFGYLRAFFSKLLIRQRVILPADLSSIPYAFFPLNSEPEISLSVYSRFYSNQIEVIRNIAQSLPLGTILVVKEHPRSVYWRKPGFYQKLLGIPNVYFVDPLCDTTYLLDNSELVVILSSFIAFEAIIRGKPVIILGRTSYNFFPSHLVKYVHSINDLPDGIKEIKIHFKRDRGYILNFLEAIYELSVPLDLYSKILGKSNRARGTAAGDFSVQEQLKNFGFYMIRRMNDEL